MDSVLKNLGQAAVGWRFGARWAREARRKRCTLDVVVSLSSSPNRTPPILPLHTNGCDVSPRSSVKDLRDYYPVLVIPSFRTFCRFQTHSFAKGSKKLDMPSLHGASTPSATAFGDTT